MNKKLKVEWINALESGRYRQGKNRLAGGGSYCCLGVLRDIAFKSEPCSIEGKYANILSPEIQRKAGLRKKQQQVLARKNDAGESFKTIAKWIRSHL